MSDLLSGIGQALALIFSGDATLAQIVGLSLQVSTVALVFAALIGLPLGAWLGQSRFRGQGLALALVYTGMGLPPVVVGLFVYLFLSRQGPLGFLGWLFTPNAMIVAQTIIALPLIVGFTLAAVNSVEPELRQQLMSLGATRVQATFTIMREARVGVVVALVAGFGGIISEVGAVMLVGGDIAGSTRVLTTAIVLETRQGQFDQALALGIILLALSFLINSFVIVLEGRLGRNGMRQA
jgi:tungstate transport system permease protein